MPAQVNVRVGISLMLAGMLMFTLNDVMGKWLLGDYSVAQLMAVRSLSALKRFHFILKHIRQHESSSRIPSG